MGPYTMELDSSLSSGSGDIPYTSEVEGKMMRFLYLAHLRTIARLASKSNSKTRRGSLTYWAGLAMATSGSTASHFFTWYSIHSWEIVMSPSTNLNRGLSRQLPSLWSPTSMP